MITYNIVKSYLTQEKSHPRRELVASRTRTTHCAKMAWRKENFVRRDRSRDKMMLGTSKGWALGRDNGRNCSVTRGIRIEATCGGVDPLQNGKKKRLQAEEGLVNYKHRPPERE
jgi:hypothetical protein